MIGTLYTKTEYSMLNSTLQLEALFSLHKERGYDFISLVDDNLHALYKFLKLSEKYQIKSIIGLDIKLNFREMNLNFLVYARNDKELKILTKLATKKEVSDELNFADVISDLKELVVVIPSFQSYILNNYANKELLTEIFKYLKERIKSFYIGVSNQSELLTNVTTYLKEIARELEIGLLPTRKISYANKEDQKTYHVLRKIENNLYEESYEDLSLITKQDLIKEYKKEHGIFDFQYEVFKNTKYTYLNNKFELPKYPTKDNVDAKSYLEALAKLGLKKRLEKIEHKNEKVYQDRLVHELNVIDQMGYNDYFLIVYDFVKFAKTNDILVGPGRGSAAGSLVAYCLGITEVDPIQYDLLFERFLNIDRRTMPDIDLDFPDNKRDLVIDYVKNKYGEKHVVTISTFTTFAEKSSIRDIARILKLDNSRTTAIINAMQKNKLDETDYEAIELISVAKTLEGLPRQTGTHAAGIILSKENLDDFVPLQKGPHDMLQSQLEASDLESLGFLKIDFLGLRNLAIIDEIYKLEKIDTKLSDIPLDDKKTFETLKNVETTGIFQLESYGMKNVIRKLKPETFEDIVALLALFRPGPMDFIDSYIKSRHGGGFELVDPSIDEVLKPTFGIIVYQEQIMKIAQMFAGYSLSQADLLRRGIAKKDKEILEKEKSNFVKKAIENGRDEKVALKIYDYIERFADYGFNRSHSVAYALLAYQMAYLKTHYFQTFMSVLLSSVTSNTELVENYVKEVRSKKYDVLKPDIRYSTDKFIKTKYSILSPLLLIKGLGVNTVEKILEERAKGPFKDYNEFKVRMKGILNEKNLISLIHAGALDSFGLTHATMLASTNLNQTGFENFLDDYKEKEFSELDFEILKAHEKEAIGFNLYYVMDLTFKTLTEKYGLENPDFTKNQVKFIGKVLKVKTIKTKQNANMCFVDFDCGKEEISATIFPKEYNDYVKLLDEKYLLVYASSSEKGYIVNKIEKVKV
nr:DNA polymerase III subunit alpha [Acholeplasma hippikon]